MAQSKKFLPLAAMEKVMKLSGAERVSDEAKAALKEVVEDKVMVIAQNAVKLALHAGRKTVKAEDVKLAAKQG